jgi:hypothetical protein
MGEKFRIYNPGPNPAKELKPGIGTFEIPADGSIYVDDRSLAKSLVVDSGRHLQAFDENGKKVIF